MTSWMAITPKYAGAEVVLPTDTEHDVWSDDGPGENPALVIGNGGDDAVVFEGALAEIGETIRRINRAYYAALDAVRVAAPLPPAVTFDAAALRRWLTTPAFHGGPDGFTRAVNLRIPGQFDNGRHHIGDLVDDVLVELLNDTTTSPHPFRLAPDITAVSAYATHARGVFDGGAGVVVQMTGDVDSPTFDLHVGPFPFSWESLLAGAPDEVRGGDGVIRMPGVFAVTLAIGNIIDPINKVVDNWRKQTRPIKAREGLAATLSEDEIECALRTLAELHNDEDPDDLSKRQLDVMARLGKQYTAEMFDEDEATGEPPTCILTGQDGENPDDCTTHEHDATAGTLVWESAGTDEPGDQNATSAYTPEGCTWVWYSIGPDRYGWSIVLIGCNEGQEVFHTAIGVADDEAGAKSFAENYEKNINTPE